MNDKLTIKYFPENDFVKEPYHASEEAAGYGLFATETKTLLPKTSDCVRLPFRSAIPEGFYRKFFLRSGLLKKRFVKCDDGVIDSDYRGIINVIMINLHSQRNFHY